MHEELNIDIFEEELKLLSSGEVHFAKDFRHRVKSAVIVDNPFERAMAMFLKEIMNNFREIEMFSTPEEAMEWLEEGALCLRSLT